MFFTRYTRWLSYSETVTPSVEVAAFRGRM
jgi:hypothetical protein